MAGDASKMEKAVSIPAPDVKTLPLKNPEGGTLSNASQQLSA